MDFTYVVAPHLHPAAPSHETPSQFLIARKIRTTIASPQISPSTSFSASTMERESVLHDINSQQSFEALPLKPNGQRKNTGAHDRIPSDPAISRHESPSGVRRRSLPKHDRPARSMGTCNFYLRLVLVFVVVARWSKDLFVIFITFGALCLCTTLENFDDYQ